MDEMKAYWLMGDKGVVRVSTQVPNRQDSLGEKYSDFPGAQTVARDPPDLVCWPLLWHAGQSWDQGRRKM